MNKDLIGDRLRDAMPTTSMDEILQQWFHYDIEVRVQNAGVSINSEKLITSIRGAWGRVLMDTASQSALDGKYCQWSMPCALSVFFVEHLRAGRDAAPKPYVFSVVKQDQDLVVTLRIFGFASEWAQIAQDALVRALTKKITWHDFQIPKNMVVRITDVKMRATDGLRIDKDIQNGVVLVECKTGLDDPQGKILDNPKLLLERAICRFVSLARWIDLDVVSLSDSLFEDLSKVRVIESSLRVEPQFISSRKSKSGYRSALIGHVQLEECSSALIQCLTLASHAGIGRGTTKGQGRIELSPVETIRGEKSST